jgi:ferredoxin-NADP reductase
MVRAAAQAGAEWTLDYAGRSLSTMAFVDELRALDGGAGRVRLYPADSGARLDVAGLVDAAGDGGPVYACGPARLIAALEDGFEAAGRAAALHVERFEAIEYGEPVWPDPFEVELALSGDIVTVQPGQSVLEAIEEQSPRRWCSPAAVAGRAAPARCPSWRARSSTATPCSRRSSASRARS